MFHIFIDKVCICYDNMLLILVSIVFKKFNLLYGTGNEDAGVHGDVDGDEKERDDILREQVIPLRDGA